ncbi:MAG TPA: methyltransferase domain-containing protein [Candidatus Bathyarchaeota archaeon]|nr:methyltransferase domain-containing protein [Candidatus Bathyarchaeota archaeon]
MNSNKYLEMQKLNINLSAPNKQSVWLMVTTIPGLEDIVLKEASEKINVIEAEPRFSDVGGRVSLRIPENQVGEVFKLRSIEHIIQLIKVFEISKGANGLNQIYNGVYECEVPLGSTFRVTCERVGEHEFTSIDVQRVAGQALVDKYGRKVDLKNPETIVRVDIVYNLCIVGIQKTKTSLRIRYPRVFQHYSALNPVIAYAMLRLAEVKPGDRVLDAFCGGGTIMIEAAQVWEDLDLLGIDISSKIIEGAWRNSESAGVKDKVKFIVGDSRRLEKVLPANWKVDKVVSNLPFGIRSGRRKVIPEIYTEFLRSLKPFLRRESKLCLLTIHKKLMETISGNLGYRVIESKQILYGGLQAWIILLKPEF